MNVLFILNDPPYGSERPYNALRVAQALRRNDPGGSVAIFLLGDAVFCAKRNQKPPQGAPGIEPMLLQLVKDGATLSACRTNLETRGMEDIELIEGARRSNMNELSAASAAADKVLVF